jgi:shikimate kinase
MEKITLPIYLIGMPGSGKSAVAKQLSQTLMLPLIDLDHEIEKHAHMFIEEIFESYGERVFREKESQILKTHAQEKAVIACGGGIVLNPEHKNIMQHGTVIYIMVDVNIIEERLKYSTHRPILKTKSIQQIYDERMFKYLDFADVTISNERGLDQTINNIMDFLKGSQS